MSGGGQLPRLSKGQDPKAWADGFANAIELRLQAIEKAINVGWSTTNNTAPARTIDAGAATLAQTRIVVATLIDDMKNKGVLG